MATENFFINDGRNGKAVEAICEGLPQFDIVPPFTFIVETVNSVDASTFVVAPE
jgi:hypothetical protein